MLGNVPGPSHDLRASSSLAPGMTNGPLLVPSQAGKPEVPRGGVWHAALTRMLPRSTRAPIAAALITIMGKLLETGVWHVHGLGSARWAGFDTHRSRGRDNRLTRRA